MSFDAMTNFYGTFISCLKVAMLIWHVLLLTKICILLFFYELIGASNGFGPMSKNKA
jgi:hypothetical protein